MVLQRAISYLSIFLTDFDIEDPDHDLAGFGEVEPPARTPSPQCGAAAASPLQPRPAHHAHAAVGDPPQQADAGGEASSDSGSEDDVFAPAARRARALRAGAAHKRWSSTSNLVALGRDAPAPARGRDEEVQQAMSSPRSVGEAPPHPRSSWMVWLKRRWSPLKENRLQTLIDDGGVKGVWLLERYLGEQTRGLEDEQAELIKREALGDSSAPLPHFPQGRSSDADAPHIAPRAEARAGRHHSPDRLVDGAHWGAPSQALATPDETAAAHGAAVKDIVVVRSWGGCPPSPTTSSPRSAANLGEALCASVRAQSCTQAGEADADSPAAAEADAARRACDGADAGQDGCRALSIDSRETSSETRRQSSFSQASTATKEHAGGVSPAKSAADGAASAPPARLRIVEC